MAHEEPKLLGSVRHGVHAAKNRHTHVWELKKYLMFHNVGVKSIRSEEVLQEITTFYIPFKMSELVEYSLHGHVWSVAWRSSTVEQYLSVSECCRINDKDPGRGEATRFGALEYDDEHARTLTRKLHHNVTMSSVSLLFPSFAFKFKF